MVRSHFEFDAVRHQSAVLLQRCRVVAVGRHTMEVVRVHGLRRKEQRALVSCGFYVY